jgi:polyisoprenoid-binding protein YceI
MEGEMFNLKKTILLTVLSVLWLGTTTASAARYEIVVGDQSEIVFKSKAPLEKFDGKTRELKGFFEADLNNLSGSVNLEVEVDLASFDTGKKKRNQHMRENHLETDKFPKAWFRAGSIVRCDKVALSAGQNTTLVVSGTLDLHGVERGHEVTLEVVHQNDGSVIITGEFPVLISDHDIERPKFLVMKLADEQLVQIRLLAQPTSKE